MNESSLRVRALEHCNQENPIYSALKHYVEVHEEGGEVTADTQDILIVDSKTVLIDEKDTYRKLLEILFGEGGSVLFLDLDEETKQSLNEYTGFYSSGDSYAFFVSAKKDLLEKIELHMYEIKSKDEYEESESLSLPFEESEKKQPKKSGGEITTTPPHAEGISHADAKLYCESLLMIYFEPASDSYYPLDSEYKKWIYSRCYSWSTVPRGEWDGHKPEAQSTNGNLTYTIVVFLDETAFRSFQWIYMNVKGIWSTSTSGAGMNADYYLERGWSIECIEISIPTPVDDNIPLNYYDCSPKNVNNQKTVSTSVGFDVSYKTGAFHFSDSVTESIYDWKIALNTMNNWTYDQNSPYDGKQSWDEFPKDSVKYNAGKARHEIKLLPELSRKVIDFDTMSVWRNNAVSHNQIYIMPHLRVQYGYEAIKNTWPRWSGAFWRGAIATTENLYVDLGQVT